MIYTLKHRAGLHVYFPGLRLVHSQSCVHPAIYPLAQGAKQEAEGESNWQQSGLRLIILLAEAAISKARSVSMNTAFTAISQDADRKGGGGGQGIGNMRETE